MEKVILAKTGLEVSRLAFGGAPLGDEYGATAEGEALATVQAAFDAGINIFDTSPYYGRGLSEKRLGEALKGPLRAGRDKIIIATKGGVLIDP
ncbi:MAG: aldo/keto reductase [Deinococcales bacterium]